MKSIAFIDHTPFVGGAQLVLLEHVEALDHTQFKSTVICSPDNPDLNSKFQSAGARVVPIRFPVLRRPGPRDLIDTWRAVASIRRALRQCKADVVVTNTTRASYLSALATMGMRIKTIWWVRDFLYPQLLFKLLWPIPVRVIFVSRSVASAYGKLHDPKTVIFHVASSLHQDLPVPPAKLAAARRQYGLGKADAVVGFMGRLVEEKGVQDVIAAMARVLPDHPATKLLIVGTGANQRNNVEPTIRRAVSHDPLLEDAVVFAGFQSDQALHYSLFDVFVLSTRDREPFATSVVQAMMAGAAVVGTEAGGTPEIIDHDQTGLLYPPGDVEALAKCLTSLINDRGLRERLADRGRKWALQYHTEEDLARRAQLLYSEVIQSRGIRS